MTESRSKFGRLLTKAIYKIKSEGKPIEIIQDELGYAIKKEGGPSIAKWRQGGRFPEISDLEGLARELVKQKGITRRTELEQFLSYGGHPSPANLCNELFPTKERTLDKSRQQLQEELEISIPNSPLSADNEFYIRREVDSSFERLIQKRINTGQVLIAIRAPLQSGKSSLLMRGLHKADQEGAKTIKLDLDIIDKSNLDSKDRFYLYLISQDLILHHLIYNCNILLLLNYHLL